MKKHQKPAALVTGAADRIGAALARCLAEAGHPVVIHYRSSHGKAEALAAEIIKAGGQAATVGADLANRGERASLIGKAAKSFGPLGILVNNASVFEPDSVGTLSETIWDGHFALHVEAPAFLARDFAEQLAKGVTGNIINMIDARVLALSPAYFSYTLSKAALWDATRTMAQSLAPHIRVNAIGPGATLPEAHQSVASFEKAASREPLGLVATPHDIAKAMMFILNSPAMTGQMLAIDGGEHIGWPERRGPTPGHS